MDQWMQQDPNGFTTCHKVYWEGRQEGVLTYLSEPGSRASQPPELSPGKLGGGFYGQLGEDVNPPIHPPTFPLSALCDSEKKRKDKS